MSEINIEMNLKERVDANPKFESDVLRFMSASMAAASSVAEWGVWNKDFFGLQGNRINWRSRGRAFDVLGGNNLGRYFKGVDYLKGGVVGSIKSTRVTEAKGLDRLVREAYTKMIKVVKNHPKLSGITSAEIKIIMPSGTSNEVSRIVERVCAQIHLNNPGIKFNPPKIIRGIPGNVGLFLKGMGIAGGLYSAFQLSHDIEKGDVAAAIGSGSAAATTLLEIGGGLLSSTALAMSASVVGAFALGYGAGTLINDYLLSDRVKEVIGGTIGELVDHGWENIRNFYVERW